MRCLLLILVSFFITVWQLCGQTLSFSHERGFYKEPFYLEVSTDLSSATIYYTLDGSDPRTSASGVASQGTISIHVNPDSIRNRSLTPGFVVRALAYNNSDTTDCIAHTYLFLDRIITQQSVSPGAGWPSDTGTVNSQVIDYGMDPKIYTHEDYADLVDDALEAIPSIAISMAVEDLFGKEHGIYVNAKKYGRAWERAMSMEIIYPNGKEGVQVNGGIRIRGGYSRHGGNPKHAFRLFFREQYGPKKFKYPLFEEEGVNSFDKFDLRTAQNYSWSGYGGTNNTFLREVFCRDMQGDMGHVYAKSRYYHLYLNGMYWGLFMSNERPEAEFSASYMKGDKEDYDVIKADIDTVTGALNTVATDGTPDLWNKLWGMAVNGFVNEEDYLSALGKKDSCGYKEKLIDEENLIDYMLSIFFTGDFDAPISRFQDNDAPNNFFCAINRVDPDGFKYYRHDGEHTMLDVEIDRTGPFPASNGEISRSNPQYIHQQLMNRKEYRMHFADRVYFHLFNNGALTNNKCQERLNKRFSQIETAIIAESARWGDAKSSDPKTKNEHWLPAVDHIIKTYLPQRKSFVINQLINDSLFPRIMPPLFLNDTTPITNTDLTVGAGYELIFLDTNTQKGIIYYTVDGSDPMLKDGSVSAKAINATDNPRMRIKHTTVIKSRIKSGDEWSALHVQRFFVKHGFEKLRFTEIMYHPTVIGDITSNNLEFLELKNTSEKDTIFLTGVSFTEGIEYKFKDGAFLAPQDFFVLAGSPCDLQLKCPGINIDGKNFGRMSNSSETIELQDHEKNTILSMTYADKAPWPSLPDGKGHSLVPVHINPTGDSSNPEKWTVSYDNVCGSPGKDDPASVSNIEKVKTREVKVFPNPFAEGFFIEIPDLEPNEKYKVSVFNVGQQKIFEQNGTTINFYLSTQTWSSGIYFLKVTAKKEHFIKKMVKY